MSIPVRSPDRFSTPLPVPEAKSAWVVHLWNSTRLVASTAGWAAVATGCAVAAVAGPAPAVSPPHARASAAAARAIGRNVPVRELMGEPPQTRIHRPAGDGGRPLPPRQ